MHHDLLGDERENLIVVALIVSGTVTMLSLDFEVISLGKQEMEDIDVQMVMICQVQRYSVGQQKTTNLLAPELDFLGEIRHWDHDQGG